MCFLLALVLTGLCDASGMPAPVAQQGADHAQRSMTDEEMAVLRERMIREHAEKANKVFDMYVKAQQAFYRERFVEALEHVDQGLALAENADLLALKGTIFFRAGHQVDARKAFTHALTLDPAVPLLQVRGLTEWLQQERLLNR